MHRIVNRRTALCGGLSMGLGGFAALSRSASSAATVLSSFDKNSAARVLMVYFSRAGEQYWDGGRRTVAIGNTARIAGFIDNLIHPDVYRIEAADPYPKSYQATVDRNTQELHDDARPAIAHPLPDLTPYQTILLGNPVWAVQEPRIMRTFLDGVADNGLSGKTVHLFVTYAVSEMGSVMQHYERFYPQATFEHGLAIRGEDAEQGQPIVLRWLTQLGLL